MFRFLINNISFFIKYINYYINKKNVNKYKYLFVGNLWLPLRNEVVTKVLMWSREFESVNQYLTFAWYLYT